MSQIRGILPLFVAVAVGIVSGNYIFKPLIEEQAAAKNEAFNSMHASSLVDNGKSKLNPATHNATSYQGHEKDPQKTAPSMECPAPSSPNETREVDVVAAPVGKA